MIRRCSGTKIPADAPNMTISPRPDAKAAARRPASATKANLAVEMSETSSRAGWTLSAMAIVLAKSGLKSLNGIVRQARSRAAATTVPAANRPLATSIQGGFRSLTRDVATQSTSGSVTVKRLPTFGVLSTSIVPLCCSAMCWAIDRPSPVPSVEWALLAR